MIDDVVHYRVPVPFGNDTIEAYTANDSHEWRVIRPDGSTAYDTARVDGGSGMGYGCPELALRQALIATFSSPDCDADEPGWLEDRDDQRRRDIPTIGM